MKYLLSECLYQRLYQLFFALLIFLSGVLVHSPAQAAKLFSDVSFEDPFFSAITALEERGIVNGFSDGRFQPNTPISRAATLKVILLASGQDVSGVVVRNPFPDVPREEWFAGIAKKGREIGIVRGDGEGNFVPSRHVARSEALAMLFRTNGDVSLSPQESPFVDVPLHAWYAKYFSAAQSSGLISGKQAFPDHLLTRAELSDLTYRFFQKDWEHRENEGGASYYADSLEGRTMANGDPFSNRAFTAAHRTLPFGTRVRVTDRESRQSIVVEITDRGPYIEGRILDLSKASFRAIAPLSRGVTDVWFTIVPRSTPLGIPKKCDIPEEEGQIPTDFFQGIILDAPAPTLFREKEVFSFSGKVSDTKETMVSLVYNHTGQKKVIRVPVEKGVFSASLFLSEAGEGTLSLLPGGEGTAKAHPIRVFQQKCEHNIEKNTESPEQLNASVKNGETYLSWKDDANTFFRIVFEQGGALQEFFVRGQTSFLPPPSAFSHFSEGMVTITVWGSQTEKGSLERRTMWQKSPSKSIFIAPRISRQGNTIGDISLPDTFVIGKEVAFSGVSEHSLDADAIILDPDGGSLRVPLTISQESFSGRFTPEKRGMYTVEINQDNALTLFVGGIYPKNVFPLIPDFFDTHSPEETTTGDISSVRPIALSLINRDRRNHDIFPVVADSHLDSLAQFRAEDMCEKGYFGHKDTDGKTATDYRVVHGVQTFVAENIAKDVHIVGAHEHLMRSPAHRLAILDVAHTRVGFGFCRLRDKPDVFVFVQMFGGDSFQEKDLPFWRDKILEDANSMRPSTPLVPGIVLEGVAQQWANTMAKGDFLNFTSADTSLEETLREAGVNGYSQAMLLQTSSIADLEGEFSQETISLGASDVLQDNFLRDTDFNTVGVGIAQNDAWEIFVVILALDSE